MKRSHVVLLSVGAVLLVALLWARVTGLVVFIDFGKARFEAGFDRGTVGAAPRD